MKGKKTQNRTKFPLVLPSSQCKENVNVFGDGAFKEVIKLKRGRQGDP